MTPKQFETWFDKEFSAGGARNYNREQIIKF